MGTLTACTTTDRALVHGTSFTYAHNDIRNKAIPRFCGKCSGAAVIRARPNIHRGRFRGSLDQDGRNPLSTCHRRTGERPRSEMALDSHRVDCYGTDRRRLLRTPCEEAARAASGMPRAPLNSRSLFL